MADDRDYGYPDISQEPIPYDCTYDKADGIFRSYKFSLRIDPKLWLWQDGGMFTYDGQTWILDISVYPSERYDRLYETASRRGRVDFGGLGFQEYDIISEKKYAIDDVRCYCCEKCMKLRMAFASMFSAAASSNGPSTITVSWSE